MSKFDALPQTRFNNLTIQVETPEGTMYVSVIEDDDEKSIAIDISIGKAGTLIRAWAQGLSRIMTVALEHGVAIEKFVEELSMLHSHRSRRSIDKVDIWSGPEGVCIALLKYKRDKFNRARKANGIADDADASRKGRIGSLRRVEG